MKIARTILVIALILTTTQVVFASDTRELGSRRFLREAGFWTQIDPTGYRYDVDSRVITMKFNESVTDGSQQELHAALGGTALRRAITGWVDVEIAAGQDVFDAIDAYMASGQVALAEPTTIGRYEAIPDDTSYGTQWHLPVIMAPEAWDTTTGTPAAIIAVLDSGTEFTHEDLGPGSDAYQNIWLNSGEDAWSDPTDPATGNGIDDDSNGLADDWKGWDFGNGDNNSAGTFFHGTAVAGTAAAKTNNATGVAGVAGGWNNAGVRIMICGVGDSGPLGAILDDAILYAADEGANVIQLSLTVGQSTAIDDAVLMARDTYNMSVICSSGNGGGSTVGYPSSNPNVMAIGATNQSDQKASFSQHGPDLEISAPGTSIFTTDIGNSYLSTSGTSFSSPIISGVIGLMLTVNPALAEEDIRQILKDTADKVGGYDYNWNASMPGHSFELGYGRVNAEAALAAVDSGIFTDGFESGDTSAWSLTIP